MTVETESKTITIQIDPVTRIEGHGKVTIRLDESGQVKDARFHIVEFRGFERFIQGRMMQEAPVAVQRLCGICPVSHHLCAAKAMDAVLGIDQLTPTAEKMRRLMHYGQIVQSHAAHFFYLACPDLLFGFDAPVMKRNIAGIVQECPDIAKRGISLHQYGQEVIRATSGKRIHPMTAVAGGFTKHLAKEEKDALYKNADSAIGWTVEALELCRKVSKLDDARMSQFGTVESNYMSICQPDGSLDLYDGLLRVIDAQGKKIFDQVKPWEYQDYLAEETRSWSYMKFPYIRSLGWENGWYRVGPLAQLNCCDFMDTPIAENERQVFKIRGKGKPVHSTLAYHEARAIISIHAAEKIKSILEDDQVLSGELMAKPGVRRKEGVAFLEAPRGTLFHHYEVDEYDQIQRANLIVSTTNNNEAMNRSIARVAFDELSGRTITEPLLNQIEVALRAYDPCLSCATHAVGQMPLKILLEGPEGEALGSRCR